LTKREPAAQLRAPADWNRRTSSVGARVLRAVPAAQLETLGDEGMGGSGPEAAAQLFGLEHGYLTLDDVVAWADSLILKLPSVSSEIIEISTSPRDVDELERRLRACIGSFESKPDRSSVLKSMKETLAAHPDRVDAIAGALVPLFAGEEADGAASDAYHVDYSFELAADHVQGDRDTATAELRVFLEKWA